MLSRALPDSDSCSRWIERLCWVIIGLMALWVIGCALLGHGPIAPAELAGLLPGAYPALRGTQPHRQPSDRAAKRRPRLALSRRLLRGRVIRRALLLSLLSLSALLVLAHVLS